VSRREADRSRTGSSRRKDTAINLHSGCEGQFDIDHVSIIPFLWHRRERSAPVKGMIARRAHLEPILEFPLDEIDLMQIIDSNGSSQKPSFQSSHQPGPHTEEVERYSLSKYFNSSFTEVFDFWSLPHDHFQRSFTCASLTEDRDCELSDLGRRVVELWDEKIDLPF